MKLKHYLAVSLCALITSTQAQVLTDEYGLVIDSSYSMSVLGGKSNDPSMLVDSSDNGKRDQQTSLSTTWNIYSPETRRICEWWDGEIPFSDDPKSPKNITLKSKEANTSDGESVSRGRVCRLWSEVPLYIYGSAHIYKSYDNVLDKPVVVVQPYIVGIDGGGYSESQFYNEVNSGGLISSLRSDGYDVVLYRYNNQDRGIGFNASGLKVLLNRLSGTSSVSSTSVVGLSMGGVVARYTLAEIENQNALNNIATFISFDAPHLGANLPKSIVDNTKRLLRKVDNSLCGLLSECREARRMLEAVVSQLNTQTFKELIVDNPSGSMERSALLSKLSSLGHVDTIPTLAITNGSASASQGYPYSSLTTHFKLYRPWYAGGSEYFKVYTKPSYDNQPGGYVDFYEVFSDLIRQQSHPITPYVTIGRKHSFVSTTSALAGSANNFSEVASFPSVNERHLQLTYNKTRKIREWLDTYQY